MPLASVLVFVRCRTTSPWVNTTSTSPPPGFARAPSNSAQAVTSLPGTTAVSDTNSSAESGRLRWTVSSFVRSLSPTFTRTTRRMASSLPGGTGISSMAAPPASVVASTGGGATASFGSSSRVRLVGSHAASTLAPWSGVSVVAVGNPSATTLRSKRPPAGALECP